MPKPKPSPSSLGIRLRRVRENRQLTQSELARRADVPVSYVNKVEAGAIQAPSADYVGKLAAVLGWTADDLLHGRPTNTTPDEDFVRRIRDALGTEKAHLFEAAFEALRELPPGERDRALEVVHVIVTNWPSQRP